MRSIQTFVTLICGIVAIATNANAATMTFGDYVYAYPDWSTGAPATYTEDGITVTGNLDVGTFGASGTVHLDDTGTEFSSKLIFTMPSRFNAVSFDLTPYPFNSYRCRNTDTSNECFDSGFSYPNVLVQGLFGNSIVASLLFDMGLGAEPFTISLGSTFNNLTSLAISAVFPVGLSSGEVDCSFPCSHFDIDNIVLSPVPVPPGIFLSLTGLGMVGMLRKRKLFFRRLGSSS